MDKNTMFEKLPENESNSESNIKRQIRKEFDRMPVLYCELLENKEKIKPELVNQDYVDDSNVYSRERDYSPEKSKESTYKSRESTYSRDRYKSRESEKSYKRSHLSRSKDHIEEDDNYDKEYDELSHRLDELRANTEESKYSYKKSSRDRRSGGRSGGDDRHRDRDRNRDSRDRSRKRSVEHNQEDEKKYIASQVAPSLSDLKYNKKVSEEIPSSTSTEQLKREMFFKLQLLKKSYKDFDPEDDFTMHTNYDEMVERYDMAVKRVRMSRDVDDYRGYLNTGFFVIEKYLAPLLSIDMEGFAQQQRVDMHKYDALLIELGEKYHVPTGSQWPVEVRLLGVMFMQTALFIISKQVMSSFKAPFIKKPTTKMAGPPVG